MTIALALPAVATPMVGAPGTVTGRVGVALLDAADGAPVPMAFLAVTMHVTAMPLVNPLTVIGVAAPVLLCPAQVAV